MAAPPDTDDELTRDSDGDAGGGDDDDSAFGALLRELAAAPDEDPVAPLPRPGEVLDGDVQIIRAIGEGGMGRVFLARDLRLGRSVAVKLVLPRGDARRRARLRELFRTEARATAALSHPGIVTVHHFGEHAGAPFLVMEHLRGQTLAERLDETEGHRLPLDDALDLALRLTDALAHAHAHGVVHRDLKPQNIFLLDDGSARILDFGLALVLADGSGRADDAPQAGTPRYMAPEAWRGESVGAPADLWALGIVLHETLTGQAPFAMADVMRGEPGAPAALPPEAAGLRDVLAALLAADPAARPDAGAALEALRQARRAPGESPADDDAAPYLYLEAFGSADAGWFFGREAEAARLRALLRRRAFVALVGPSGAGKSSLARAGLAARLLREQPAWRVLELRPGPRPLEALARAAALEGLDADALRQAPGRFAARLRERAAAEGQPVLVLVDALEELVAEAVPGDDADVFAQALCAAADDLDAPTRVLVTLRDDHLAALAGVALLRRAIVEGLMPLGAPDRAGLRAALVAPAERAGYRVEDALADAVVEALHAEPVPLPLLQLTASRLWERRDRKARRMGGGELEALGGLTGVLVTHAEEVLTGLVGPGALALARRLLCALVGPDGRRHRPRRGELLAQLGDAPAAAAVLDHLIAGRLVVGARGVDTDGAEATVEIVHDALVARWDRLQRWLDASRAERRFVERLRAAALDWDEQARRRDLLWSGESLADALGWRPLVDDALGPRERDFLAASEHAARRARRLRRALSLAGVAALVALALAAWLVALGLREQERRATIARDEADALVAFMLDDLHERLEGVGQLDVLENVAARAAAYHRDDASGAHPRRLAVALRYLGDVERARGNLERAAAHYDESIALTTHAHGRLRLHPGLDAALAAALVGRGEVDRARGQLDAARTRFASSLALRQRLLEARPDDPELARDLSVSHLKLGDVHRDAGDLAAALAAYRACLALREALTVREPTPERRHDLAVASLRLADALDATGDTDAARRALDAARAQIEPLVAENPAHALWQQTLGFVELTEGRAHLADGALERGRAHLLAARDAFARLLRLDPSNTDWRVDLAAATLRLAAVERTLGRGDDAMTAATTARDLLAPLVESDPQHGDWQHALALSWREIGASAAEQGRSADALEATRAALAIHRRLAEREPGHARWLHALADDHERLAALLTARGELEDALAASTTARDARQRLAERDPHDADALLALVNAHRRSSELHERLGRPEAAAAASRAAHEAARTRSRLDPDGAATRRQLALSAIELGNRELAAGSHDAALRAFDEASATFAELVERHPEDLRHRRDLAMMHAKRGDVLRGLGRGDEAASAFEASLEAMRVIASERATPALRRDLSVAWDRLGDARRAQQRQADAIAAYEHSLAIARELAALDPDDVRFQRDLEVSLDKLGDMLREQGEHARALEQHQQSLAIAERLAALAPEDRAWQHDLVQVHERLARTHEAAGERARARERYLSAWAIATALADAEPESPARAATLLWLAESLERVGAHGADAARERARSHAAPLRERLDTGSLQRLDRATESAQQEK